MEHCICSEYFLITARRDALALSTIHVVNKFYSFARVIYESVIITPECARSYSIVTTLVFAF